MARDRCRRRRVFEAWCWVRWMVDSKVVKIKLEYTFFLVGKIANKCQDFRPARIWDRHHFSDVALSKSLFVFNSKFSMSLYFRETLNLSTSLFTNCTTDSQGCPLPILRTNLLEDLRPIAPSIQISPSSRASVASLPLPFALGFHILVDKSTLEKNSISVII